MQIIGSDILKVEMSKIRNEDKRNDVVGLYHALVAGSVSATCEVGQRAAQIREASNIRSFDSLHLASAEIGADVLLTTDMKFLKNSQRISTRIAVKKPIEFLMEVFNYDEPDNENN